MSCGPGLQLSQQVGFSTVSAMYFYPLRLQLHYSVSTALILDFRPDPLMMRIPLRLCVFATLLVCYILLSCAIEHKNQKGGGYQSSDKKTDSNIKMKRNYITVREWRPKALTPRKKMKKTGSERISVGPGSDISCTRLGGICQANRCICQGQYLKDKCSGAKKRQCCMPAALSILCAGHHSNRVRACDVHGCGAFHSKRGNDLHKAVDLVCDDYGIVNAPFSGSLAGPVSQWGQTSQ
uniref:uncharacterized protein LOC109959973 isoform X2 n=1 Tax=Monopterus albus TaxID=43700 RepID=UPI0009B2F968|nr:uncharacterized protein LOC109959973 isoform X2 [Monopterus albus]